jgi:hypothetical protein
VFILRLDEQTLVIAGMNSRVCELIKQIPDCAEVDDDDAARARLFSSPSGGAFPQIDGDWKSYVEPDLRELFQSAKEVVKEDLADFPPSKAEPFYTLEIPVKHLSSWINALNQARLAIGARYALTEHDMEHESEAQDVKALAIMQIHFYGNLQAHFLTELGDV